MGFLECNSFVPLSFFGGPGKGESVSWPLPKAIGRGATP